MGLLFKFVYCFDVTQSEKTGTSKVHVGVAGGQKGAAMDYGEGE